MKVRHNGREFTVEVTADGEGVVSHAGAALLAETAGRIGLTDALSKGLAPMRERRGAHDPGRVVRDLAVMLASGGEHLSDLRSVRDQGPLFGAVASDATAWRTVEAIARDPKLMGVLRSARRQAREGAWAAGAEPEGPLFIDLDPTLIEAGSEKEGAAGTFKGGFGFHPMLAFLDRPGDACGGEPLAGLFCGRATPAPTRWPIRSRRQKRRSSSYRQTSPPTRRSSCAATPPAPRTTCLTGRKREGSASRSAWI
jgi:hypothetical protein